MEPVSLVHGYSGTSLAFLPGGYDEKTSGFHVINPLAEYVSISILKDKFKILESLQPHRIIL